MVLTMNDPIRVERAADWLQRLRECANDPEVVTAWAQWSAEHADNEQAYEKVEAIWAALGSPEGLKRLQGYRAKPVRRRIPQRISLIAVAATVLVTIATAVIRYVSVDRGHLIATGIGQLNSQKLADGSNVELGARTRIRADYSQSQRRMILEAGEAYFTVAKDAHRPFVVESGDVLITALGTQFNIHRLTERTTVTVTEGSVSVENSADEAPFRLLASEQMSFDRSSRRSSVAVVDVKRTLSWRNGILRFVNQPLRNVIEDVNRYSDSKVSIADAALGEQLYTGTIYPERIGDWLNALQEIFPLRVKRKGGGILLEESSK
jgi:transmembrane sensor